MSDNRALSGPAKQLADLYALALDLVERCGHDVGTGQWALLEDSAARLSLASDELAAAASALTRQETATPPQEVLDVVARNVTGGASPVFELLHPQA